MFHVFSFRLRIEHYLFTQKSMDYFQFCRLEALWTSWRRGAITWGTRSTMQATRSTDSAWWLVSLSSLLPNIFILRLSLLQKYHINQKSWVCVSIYKKLYICHGIYPNLLVLISFSSWSFRTTTAFFRSSTATTPNLRCVGIYFGSNGNSGQIWQWNYLIFKLPQLSLWWWR